ncbi:secreted glycosyl hydrolase [Novosphingobium sp. AAP83]|uniref:ThuA domain-containing protein n=1 Tax=Novosphingobium sp. AAP83 TaxID=1523425 RepID=UPI0006B9409A|nr:ThuA domain-containing protein [Novosphingobium sp. AAP83]KPF93671.1 secreted glycosyl hydrolase [Novosphingobium sp. AAP83]
MSQFGFKLVASALALCAISGGVASAKPVTDCPLRDAPFSMESPLVDILLNAEAKAIVEQRTGRSFDKGPAAFVGTKPPTFAAILTLRSAAMFTGLKPEALPEIDAALRKLPVTEADKIARCDRYDNDVPKFAPATGKPRMLLFEKITGFRDSPSVDAAHAAFIEMGKRNGWSIATTDKGGAINPKTLKQFDAVIWNNISGDVLTLSQRKAFKTYLERGGGFFAIHGSAGDPAFFWDWYTDTLIGARFLAHPMKPQFQEARIAVDKAHPLAAGLPPEWKMSDEWYSFKTNPRSVGAKVLLTLDEASYVPIGPQGIDLKMGDHPLAWTNCVGKGRMFYSAIGHLPETYSQPQHVTLLENAMRWVALDRKACTGRP